MPKFQGRTGQVLKIKLPSSIVNCRWGLDEVALGGKIPLEVWTQWVADDSDIEVKIKDLEGGTVETVKGKVFSDLFRIQYPVSKPNKTGGMYFEAELKAHGLKAVGPKVKVGPPVRWSDLKWMAGGKEAGEIEEGKSIDLTAKIEGVEDGKEAFLSIFCAKDGHAPTRFRTFPALVKGGRVQVSWLVSLPGKAESLAVQSELNKASLEYVAPALTFEASYNGVKAASPEARLASWVEFDFGPPPEAGQKRTAVLEMPDGGEKKENVPEDGIVRVASPPGRVAFKGFENG